MTHAHTHKHLHKYPHKRTFSFRTFIPLVLALAVAVLFIIKFGGPSIMKLYIQAGIGDCKKIPILCMVPEEQMKDPAVDKDAIADFIPHDFPKMSVSVPRGFTVVQELITKVYYKRRWSNQSGPAMFFLCQERNFFIDRYPQIKALGLNNDYEFIKRVMYARFSDIKTIQDMFFVVMKGVFLPDLGNQSLVKMAEFELDGKRGFLSYSFTKQGNFFVADLLNQEGVYFKVYIRDQESKLTLGKVFAMISTFKGK